jgi:hypothetical protein
MTDVLTSPNLPPYHIRQLRHLMSFYFLADEAYPLLLNMLKPYSKHQLDSDKELFNSRLSRALSA